METFAPRERKGDDNDYHKQIRFFSGQSANTEDDRYFTTPEIKNIVENMKNKAPAEDGITCVIYNQAFKTVPKFITAIYNSCLKQGLFSAVWK